MASTMSRILPFLLITVICITGVEFFYLLASKHLFILPVSLKSTDNNLSENGRSEIIKEEISVGSYEIIIERNLFGGKTDESPVDNKQNTPLVKSTLALVLMGTIEDSEKSGRAIVLDKKTSKQDLYGVGDDIQGATLTEILRGKVILRYQEEDQVLDMSESSKYAPKKASNPVAISPAIRNSRVVLNPDQVIDLKENPPIERPVITRPVRRVRTRKETSDI